jgi:addiction module RelE/StbE family toxin
MKILLDDNIIEDAKKLPKRIQEKLARLLEILQNNPFHPLLHSKKLTGDLIGFLSFRITQEWRVIFYFQKTDVIKIIKIGHRKDIYK